MPSITPRTTATDGAVGEHGTTATDGAVGEHDPIDIRSINRAAPWWPFGTDSTYRLVRRGELGAIAVGRRRYVTLSLLREFIARHTLGATAA